MEGRTNLQYNNRLINISSNTHALAGQKKNEAICVILTKDMMAHFKDCRAEEVVTRLDKRPTSKALL